MNNGIYSIAKNKIKWTLDEVPEIVNTYIHKITERRKLLGYSQRDLAKLVGVSVNTIQSYESGALPRGEHFLNLACALQCSLDWLVGLNYGGPSWPILDTTDHNAYNSVAESDSVWFPRKSWIYPKFLTETSDANSSSPVSFERKWLQQLVNDVSQAVLYTVKGPSMEPSFHNGDLCLVNTSQTQIYQGQVYVIKLDENYFINRLEARPNGIIRIISDNKDIAPPYEIDAENVSVQGQVVWKGRSI